MMKKILLISMLVFLLVSCETVKPYQQMNLNDPDMVLQPEKAKKFVTTFQAYREGASGANGGKSGGGCGCN
ncbi:MAG: DUF4266 domain-containing protein [Chlorobi bacterium]|nr:DUF4266 domain-containing protein [Chlorobiota bacterium]